MPRVATPHPGPWRVPGQGELFQAARPSWREWIRWLLRSDYKSFGVRCFGGDPEQARIAVTKILEESNQRRFDVAWLDYLAEELGRGGEEAIVRFVADRYGFEMPARKTDPVRVQEELAAVKETLANVSEALAGVVKAVEHIEGGTK